MQLIVRLDMERQEVILLKILQKTILMSIGEYANHKRKIKKSIKPNVNTSITIM